MSAREQTNGSAVWPRTATVAVLAAMAILGAVIPVSRAITPALDQPAASSPEEPEAVPVSGS